MRATTWVLAIGLAAGLCGCGEKSADSGPPAPLSVADWKTLPLDKKYESETLERLKQGDPSLATPEGWEVFQKTVVAPARRKDFPNGKSR